MKIMIDIPEYVKENIDNLDEEFNAINEAFYGSVAIMAIQQGTPLPDTILEDFLEWLNADCPVIYPHRNAEVEE